MWDFRGTGAEASDLGSVCALTSRPTQAPLLHETRFQLGLSIPKLRGGCGSPETIVPDRWLSWPRGPQGLFVVPLRSTTAQPLALRKLAVAPGRHCYAIDPLYCRQETPHRRVGVRKALSRGTVANPRSSLKEETLLSSL
jgi:hypothetical protein